MHVIRMAGVGTAAFVFEFGGAGRVNLGPEWSQWHNRSFRNNIMKCVSRWYGMKYKAANIVNLG